MSKLCTVKLASEYLREWAGFAAVKKESSDAGYHYFTGVDRAGERQYIRVDKHTDDEQQYNIEQRDNDTMSWDWIDAVTAENKEE